MSGPSRHYVLAAGGTGGHLIPAFALAVELERRGHHVALITDDRGARFPGLFEAIPVHILPAGRLGGGPIGCELAQAFARLGSAVTVIEMAPRLLPREDADAAEIVQRRLAAEGVALRLGASIEQVELRGGERVLRVRAASVR